MPLAKDAEVAEHIEKHGPIRLGCRNCFREDMDGIRLFPGDWEDIGEAQSLRDSLSTYDGNDYDDPPPPGYSVLDWWTHLGNCPECR